MVSFTILFICIYLALKPAVVFKNIKVLYRSSFVEFEEEDGKPLYVNLDSLAFNDKVTSWVRYIALWMFVIQLDIIRRDREMEIDRINYKKIFNKE